MFVFEVFSFAANSLSLAHLVEFVKHFFEVFSNSFMLFVALQAFAFHHATFICYHRYFFLSRVFFLFLGSFLIHLAVSRTASIYYHRFAHLSSTILQISTFFFMRFAKPCFQFLQDRLLLISDSASPASMLLSSCLARSQRLTIPQSLPFSITGSLRICSLPMRPAANVTSISGLPT